MAVGDVVNGMSGAGVALFDFQPAAGVSVMVSSFGDIIAGGFFAKLYNGALSSLQTNTQNGAKIFINNTNYLQLSVSGTTNFSFTGIQLK